MGGDEESFRRIERKALLCADVCVLWHRAFNRPTFAPTDCKVYQLDDGASIRQVAEMELPESFYKVNAGDVHLQLQHAQSISKPSDAPLLTRELRERYKREKDSKWYERLAQCTPVHPPNRMWRERYAH